MPVATVQERFRKLVAAIGVNRRARVVVGYSGGVDSTCLLHLFHQLAGEEALHLVAVTVDHGLRPFHREAQVTAAFCDTLAVEHRMVRLPPGLRERAATAGYSLEQAAREERYAVLHRVAKECGADRIAVGHHADDQAETVVLRLLRGAGLGGLAAMRPETRAGVIRPLLDIPRAKLLAYALALDLPTVQDPTNAQRHFLRNCVRAEVIPALTGCVPEAVSIVARSARVTSEQWEATRALADERLAAAWLDGAWPDQEGAPDRSRPLCFAIDALGEGPVRRLLLHRLFERLRGLPLESRHVEAVDRHLACRDGSGELHLPGGLRVERVYERLIVRLRPAGVPEVFSIVLAGEGETAFPGGRVRVSHLDSCPDPRQVSAHTTYLGQAGLQFPLRLRTPLPGDRIQPLGMRGSQLLSDLFTDRKVPRNERRGVPILVDARERILWVPGVRRAAHAPARRGEPAWRLDVELTSSRS